MLFSTLREPLSIWTAEPLDLLVVGGGATGLGVAVQAALEGRRVALVEARDFASGTSSRSTKLLHGGVRYLAQGHWPLVREALRERAIVLGNAPHLAQPLPFVVAETAWAHWLFTALGLKLYDWLAGRLSLGRTQLLSPRNLQGLLPGLSRQLPGLGDTEQDCVQGGQSFRVRLQVQGTPNPSFRRLDAHVFAERTPVLRVTTVLGRQ